MTATTLGPNAQFKGVIANTTTQLPDQGNATLIGGNGTVNTFQFGAIVVSGTGTASVLLNSGTSPVTIGSLFHLLLHPYIQFIPTQSPLGWVGLQIDLTR